MYAEILNHSMIYQDAEEVYGSFSLNKMAIIPTNNQYANLLNHTSIKACVYSTLLQIVTRAFQTS